jgi:hypothetical protein
MSVILAMWEKEVEESQSKAKTRPYLKNKLKEKKWVEGAGMA